MPSASAKRAQIIQTIPFWLVVGAVWLITTVTSFGIVERDAKDQARKAAEETLNVQIESLNGLLNRFRVLPPILARQQDVMNLFAPSAPAERVRDKLTQLAYFSGARDVALYQLDGRYYASARDAYTDSLMARPDATQLLIAPTESRLGRATLIFANGERLYGFSALVGGVSNPIGVVVFYVDLAGIEDAWALSRLPIFVANQMQQIILSNVPEWRGKYLKDAIVIEAASPQVFFENQLRDAEPAVRALTLLEWDMHVMGLTPALNRTKQYAMLLSFLITVTVALVLILFTRRREAAIQAERLERANALRLERLVTRRTRDLHASNVSLQHEIEERKLAEEKLIKAQEEVVRAAKFAAIGQMSATLSHEYNQPLSAIGTYAENAEKFLAMGKSSHVAENLQRIQAQVERMGALSRTLLGFARQPEADSHPVNLAAVLEESRLLCAPRAKKASVNVQQDPVADDVLVYGGKIRLTQIFVNLITNAIDAAASVDAGLVQIATIAKSDWVEIAVIDNGQGVAPELKTHIFEPFFTTKEAGVGLGIGLSIVSDLVHEFGGQITVEDAIGGGAQFRVSLRRVILENQS